MSQQDNSVNEGDSDNNPSPSILPNVMLESSPLDTMTNDFHLALDEFRNNWQRELKEQTVVAAEATQQQIQAGAVVEEQQENVTNDLLNDSLNATIMTQQQQLQDAENDKQLQAVQLFCKAVELEQRGKVYDALPLYRKAVQMVPDIEFKFNEQQFKQNKTTTNADITTNVKSFGSNSRLHDGIAAEAAEELDIIDDLYEKFQMDVANDYYGKLLLNARVRDAGVLTTELHISDLPPEILLYILRWVISMQLDMRSLEQCAAVCKGLYICARDDELWRLACIKVWGANVGTLNTPIPSSTSVDIMATPEHPGYISWRQMFIERERVLYSGCYISKTTYLRMGENSFQDQYYRPIQLVEYYRYVRFLPDGTVLMMTNADEPTQGVTKLRHLQQIRSDILRGQYRLYGNTVTILLKKYQPTSQQQQQRFMSGSNNATTAYSGGRQKRRGSNGSEDALLNSIKFQIEFRIVSTNRRKFSQLVWQHYSIVQLRNKIETTSEFDLTPSKYPSLWFSPVRSYHLDADAPLA